MDMHMDHVSHHQLISSSDQGPQFRSFFFLPTPNRNAAASLFCQQETKTSWMDMDVQLSRASTTTFISSDRSSSPLPAKKNPVKHTRKRRKQHTARHIMAKHHQQFQPTPAHRCSPGNSFLAWQGKRTTPLPACSSS
jgi:hypothetical protein